MKLNRLIVLLALGLALTQATAAPAPDIVKKLAQSYVLSHPDATSRPTPQTPEQVYESYFFIGMTHPHGGIMNFPDIETAAYVQGQAYWREHPFERDAIMAGFGFVRVDAEGSWARGFELSSFVPDERGAERWWLDSFGGVAWRELGPAHQDPSPNVGKVRVRIAGYLGLPGPSGHLGQYRRRVLATSLTFLKD
ncbi:MAG: hypothetical protein V4463_14790 [Pseudomonadota bacterium]